ncbi:MAG TPA: rhodanese-like domain-containing protein [Planctomycetota bacterium]|nr:rhodanese-like domain-containing protein [Planctomycetota bacterium]
MDRTPTRIPSPSTIRKPPTAVTVVELMVLIGAGTPPSLLDVREAAVFHPRHIGGSQNAPDSQTTALVRKLQTLNVAILVCNDGKLSSMVARTLGFCKLNSVAYLEGGINAWAAAGGKLVETTRSGFEHELAPPPADPGAEAPKESGPKGWIKSLKNLFGRNNE